MTVSGGERSGRHPCGAAAGVLPLLDARDFVLMVHVRQHRFKLEIEARGAHLGAGQGTRFNPVERGVGRRLAGVETMLHAQPAARGVHREDLFHQREPREVPRSARS